MALDLSRLRDGTNSDRRKTIERLREEMLDMVAGGASGSTLVAHAMQIQSAESFLGLNEEESRKKYREIMAMVKGW